MKREKALLCGWTVVIGLLVLTCGCATYRTYIHAARASEARTNLGAIFTSQVAYFGENNTYGHTFEQLGWSPDGETRYSYFIGQDVIPATLGGPNSLPAGVKSEVSATGFTAVAAGNIDNDPKLDIWTVNDAKVILQASDDNKK